MEGRQEFTNLSQNPRIESGLFEKLYSKFSRYNTKFIAISGLEKLSENLLLLWRKHETMGTRCCWSDAGINKSVTELEQE